MPTMPHIAAILTLAIAPALIAQTNLPHLENRAHATQLIVDGKPFLILGGELHNSSSSSTEFMQPAWSRLTALHLNTVLLPFAWETVEPTEGHFDFATVDALLQSARENNLHIVVLWFGSWKNTFSSYVPAWVKTDEDRFPRAQTSDGRGTERLSTFSTSARDADARAFAVLMHHLREVDGEKHTVLMVQVENEVGMIPESRDHSAAANAAFNAPVPATLITYLSDRRAKLSPELRSAWEAAGARTSGTWQQVFGTNSLTDDLFMAWHYATYIQQVAAAGKREYPLPFFANAALIRPNYEPGQYNSGGPLPHSIDLYRAAAPSLDFFSPDIYFNEFAHWATEYSRPGNALFIPEAQGGAAGSANALYAFGRLSAIGFSPFGVDDQNNTPLDLVGVTNSADKLDNSAIAHAFTVLNELAPTILEAQRNGTISAALVEGEAQRSARVAIGDYTATLTRSSKSTASRLAALFIQTAPDEFLVVGSGDAQLTFSSDRPGPPITGILSVDEEFYANGTWRPRRRLNGDESSQGQSLHLSADDLAEGRIYRLRLYRYH
jgi:hypothetical protein